MAIRNRMLRAIGALGAALALAQPNVALAWGQTGHRVVGQIADSQLTDEARRGVAAILGTEDLAEASTWADFMKSSPEKFWQEEASPWHYVTIADGTSYAQVGAPPEGDAVTALAKFRTEVIDPRTSPEERRLALRLIIHIVGDLAQPLHVGNGTDRGGNDMKLDFFGQPTNLHSVWDSGLIDRQQLSYTEMARWLLRATDIAQARPWMSTDPVGWVDEAAAIRPAVYPQSAKLSYEYGWQHDALLKTQLTKGGVRLAAYLNALFAEKAVRG